MSSLLSNISLRDCGPQWQSISCPHYYPTFHYGTADCGGSPFHVLIIIQPFTTGLQTAVAVHLMSSLLSTLSLWDCGLQWLCPFHVLIIIQPFTTGLQTVVAVHLMSSLLSNLSLWDCRLQWQSSILFSLFNYGTAGRFAQLTFLCGRVFCNCSKTN